MEMTFRRFSLTLPVRLIIFAVFQAAGITIQLVLLGSGSGTFTAFLAGLVPMAAGIFPLAAKKYTNRPADLGYEDWQPASETEVRRIASNFRLTDEAQFPVYYRSAFGAVLTSVLAVFAAVSGLLLELETLALLFLDAIVMLWPVLFFGSVSLFIPRELKMKLDTFQPVLDASRPSDIVLTPYLRLDKDKDGKRIPEDIRFLLEPRRKPDDLLGVQVQIAINDGPNGSVPYMYAVFITKGAGKSFEKLTRCDFKNFIVEKNPKGEYCTIVVRQKTTGTGYHTQEYDCLRLHEVIVKALDAVSA